VCICKGSVELSFVDHCDRRSQLCRNNPEKTNEHDRLWGASTISLFSREPYILLHHFRAVQYCAVRQRDVTVQLCDGGGESWVSRPTRHITGHFRDESDSVSRVLVIFSFVVCCTDLHQLSFFDRDCISSEQTVACTADSAMAVSPVEPAIFVVLRPPALPFSCHLISLRTFREEVA